MQAMREGAGAKVLKIFLMSFLVLAVSGLVLSDVGGFFRGGLNVDTVAKGSGIRITTQEFDRTVRRVLSSQQMSSITIQQAYQFGIIDQVLQNEIQNRLMIQRAEEMGLKINDEIVLQQIATIAEPLARNGLTKSQALQQVLRAQGISEGEFIASIRSDMQTNLLNQALAKATADAPDDIVEAIYAYENQTRDVEFVLLDRDTIEGVEQPTDEALQTFYDANKLDYSIPETRTITLAILSQDQMEKTIEISDDTLKAAYEDNIRAYQVPSRRDVEQAVFTTQQEAEAAFSEVKKGTSLKEAVESATGKEEAYLGKEAFEKDGLLPEIGEPVFEAVKGDVIGPVQTALGWHLLIVGDDKEAFTTPFDTVKDTLKKELLQVRLMDSMIETANQIDDAFAGGGDVNEVAQEFDLQTETFEQVNRAGATPDKENIFAAYEEDAQEIISLAFDFEEGDTAPILELKDGRFAAVHINKVTPIAYKPFDEVSAEVKTRWINEQKALLNRTRAEDLLAKAQSGTALRDIAAEANTSVKTANDLTKSNGRVDQISPVALATIFESKTGDVVSAESGDDIVLVKVSAIELADPAKAKEEDMDALKERIAREMPQETYTQFMNNIAQASKVKINKALLDRLYGAEQPLL